ncbi:MAG: type II toxin-antitoxin system MqsA family antitoxin [Actinomycetota bacterium]
MGFHLPTESDAVKCAICKQGETRVGATTVTLEREGTVLVVKGVPADVCENCGEAYVSEAVASRLLSEIAQAATAGIGVEVRRYAA